MGLKLIGLALVIMLPLALLGSVGPVVQASDNTSDNATVNLEVEVVYPSRGGGGGGGGSPIMFKLYDLTVKNITENSADILWRTNRLTRSELTYWSSPEVTIENWRYLSEHIVRLGELEDDTTYYFRIVCVDDYGLMKRSDEAEFTTLKKEIVLEPEEEEVVPPPEEEEIAPPTEPEEVELPEEEVVTEEEEEVAVAFPPNWWFISIVLTMVIVVIVALFYYFLVIRRRNEKEEL